MLLKKSKRHFIPHMILVQMIYKRSCADKMATKRCRTEDGLPGKEGAELHHFIYGEFFNIYYRILCEQIKGQKCALFSIKHC